MEPQDLNVLRAVQDIESEGDIATAEAVTERLRPSYLPIAGRMDRLAASGLLRRLDQPELPSSEPPQPPPRRGYELTDRGRGALREA